jgi:hypothetical protein
LEGGVAIFNLVNIDRPGAVSKLTIERMSTSQSIYEFLPVTIDVTVKNTGNVISQPSGTLFMQRSFDSEEPLATIDLNAAEGYILPGKSRTFSLEWANGFPRHTTTKTTDNAEPTKKLSWDWRQINELRMGRYTAKAVMVYNDGQRSTPVTSSIRFWVMPWRLIAGAVVLLGLLGLGLAASGWLGFKAAKKVQLRKRGHGKK